MKPSGISMATVDELVVMYAEAAALQRQMVSIGNAKKANRSSDLLFAIYRELRSRGSDAQMALLPLLQSEDLGVRLWSATHALEFAPREAEPVLEVLTQADGLVGLEADFGLKLWRKGELRFP